MQLVVSPRRLGVRGVVSLTAVAGVLGCTGVLGAPDRYRGPASAAARPGAPGAAPANLGQAAAARPSLQSAGSCRPLACRRPGASGTRRSARAPRPAGLSAGVQSLGSPTFDAT